MGLLDIIKNHAKKQSKRIVLPEGTEPRTLQAADIALNDGLAQIILIGNPTEIRSYANEHELKHIEKATIIDPELFDKSSAYADLMVELRKKKGMTREQALELLSNPLHLATMMIKNGDADGEVAGARNATGDVLRPAFQYVKTLPGISVVSGAFLMILPEDTYGENGLLVFADCAVHPDPDDKQLAEIAVATAQTARSIAKIEPRVAMLSFRPRAAQGMNWWTK
jgi:phosphate acetyltransferase